jgi:hypothetical protein
MTFETKKIQIKTVKIMKKIITLLILMIAFGQMSYGQFKEIPYPGWAKAKSEIYKHKSFIEKEVAKYGYTFNDLTIVRKTGGHNKGVLKRHSVNAKNCYIDLHNKYKDVWPKDLVFYYFLLKAPENKDGITYTFNLSIAFLRSKFSGKNDCYGQLLNSFYYDNMYLGKESIEGIKAIPQEKLPIAYFEYLDNQEYKFYDKTIPKMITIDSLKFSLKEREENGYEIYEVIRYSKKAVYDDFMPVKLFQHKEIFEFSFLVKDPVKMKIKAYKTGIMVDDFDTIIYKIDENTLVYEKFKEDNTRKAIDYFQKAFEVTPPALSKYGLNKIQNKYYPLLKNKDYKDIKDNAYLKQLFSSQEDLKLFSEYFQEFKYGLWTIEKEEIDLLSDDRNNYQESKIKIRLHVDRNLTKLQMKSIKGKVSKESYKNAKYHYGGTSYVTLKLNLKDGKPIISAIEIKSSIRARR